MNNILLFHIGYGKTGTSALQTFLFENEKILNEYGWSYPDLKKELYTSPAERSNSGIRVKNGSVFFETGNKINILSDRWKRAWECVLKHLENKNVIISAEEFSVNDTEKFLAGAVERYDNIRVVIYLRRQDKAFESFWNENVKGMKCFSQTFQEYSNSIKALEMEKYHYLSKLEEISRIVGKENLIVRIYEKQQLFGEKHVIESDFLSILGIESGLSKWKECGIKNAKLYGNYIELKRVCNSVLSSKGYNSKKYAKDFFVKLSSSYGKEEAETGYFSKEERKNFLEQFAAENEQIAREYLHREDGILFYDNKIDYHLHNVQCSPLEEDMIRMVSAMLCDYQRVYTQNCILIRQLLLQNIRGRQLMLFGAGKRCRELLNTINLPVTLIADNDETRHGEMFWEEIEITCAKSIDNWSEYFVIITCAVTDEIEEQLQRMGLKKGEDYVLAKEYIV